MRRRESLPTLDDLWQPRGRYGSPQSSREWIIAAVAGVAIAGAAVSAYGASSGRGAARLTPGEKHYMTQQQQREEEAYRFNQLMTPFMLEDMGLEADFGADGQITAIRRRAKTAKELQQDEIIDLAQKKTIKGLKGELDVDPQTELAVKRNLDLKREQVRRTYGPGGDVGTGGQNVMNLAQTSGDALREAVRRGEMSNAEAISRMNIAQQEAQDRWQSDQARGLPFDMMRLGQMETPWDSYRGGAKRAAAAADAAFYSQLGGIIGSTGTSILGGVGGMGGMGGGAAGGAGMNMGGI